MKHKSVTKFMYDIIDAINAINEFIGEITDFNSFVTSRLLTSAVERELQVIWRSSLQCDKARSHPGNFRNSAN
ncbi:hypothetical protein [Chitinophaga sp. sic0106]|uniref:hypothetical protein n=1 Tax=Chitinophaga sp. sic0106 TaxID=2854785 RepID=UPI001C4845CB|nr:hypothetical protein [Chitinophaga sp. sic0106]MBV7533199.1 hypothetical protein [Chitinophaga sp. sic0106]